MEQIDKLQSQILEHKAYLYDTDYVVIRSQETGQGIPEDVKDITYADMKRIAKENGINSHGMSKETLLEAIKEYI